MTAAYPAAIAVLTRGPAITGRDDAGTTLTTVDVPGAAVTPRPVAGVTVRPT